MIVICVFISIFIPIISADDFVLPAGNYTPDYEKRPGPCPDISSPYLVATNMSLYGGRWFITKMGLSKKEVSKLSCSTADTVVDDEGRFNDYFVHDVNGVRRIANVVWQPVEGKPGYFTFQASEDILFKEVYFYNDAEMFVMSYVACFAGKDYHYANTEVGMRKLKYRKEKAKQIKRVLEVLGERGGFTGPLYDITYNKSCEYLPLDWYENF